MIEESCERRVNTIDLAVRVDLLTKLVDQLSYDTRFNSRLAIIAVCVIAAGKEILQAFK